jgi:hypothetical protein
LMLTFSRIVGGCEADDGGSMWIEWMPTDRENSSAIPNINFKSLTVIAVDSKCL